MIWPDYSIWTRVGMGAAVVIGLVGLVLAWRRVGVGLPGLRFPIGARLKGVKRGWRARFIHLPLAVRSAAVLVMLFAFTRPQMPDPQAADVEGIDIVVALDLSGSMASVDISDDDLVAMQNAGEQPPNRFVVAVDVLKRFIEGRTHDRVSLVVFGKDAFLQFPLTLDYGAMLRVLDALRLDDIDGSGTVIGNALAMSLSRLEESDAKSKLVILLTDGEDNGSNVAPVEMAKEAKKRGVHVFPILVGTEDQSRQPTGQVDLFTGRQIYQKVDNAVNAGLLEQIAKLTDAQFYRATDGEKLAHDFRDILDTFEKSRLVDYTSAEPTELFPYLLYLALMLLLLELLLAQTILRRFP